MRRPPNSSSLPYILHMKWAPLFWSFVLACGCGVPPQGPSHNGGSAIPTSPANGNDLPPGFDIRVFAEGGDAGETAQITLVTELDVPEGSYVISALTERPYLGKFSVNWNDPSVSALSLLTESPISMPGLEPFEQVYVPMLMEPTVLRQTWNLPNASDTYDGQVFLVLEPQCMPYALDFTVEKETDGWACTYGEVHPEYPE